MNTTNGYQIKNEIEDIRNMVQDTTKNPPDIKEVYNIRIFKDDREFPQDYNMDIFRYNIEVKEQQDLEFKNRINRQIMGPLKQKNEELLSYRKQQGNKKVEKKLYIQQIASLKKINEENSSKDSNEESDSEEEEEMELNKQEIEELENKLNDCESQIDKLKSEIQKTKFAIIRLKSQLMGTQKGLAADEEDYPDNFFDFKINPRLKEMSNNINLKLGNKVKDLGNNVIKYKNDDQKLLKDRIKDIENQYDELILREDLDFIG